MGWVGREGGLWEKESEALNGWDENSSICLSLMIIIYEKMGHVE